MIDIGANLSNRQFDNDIEEVIIRAKDNNISSLILTSVDLDTYFKNINIINSYQHILPIYNTYGLHPHNANNWQEVFNDIQNHLQHPSIKAIGEFGLDYFRMISPQNIQTKVMEMFLDEAKNFPHLPLFLHERESFDDFYHILKSSHVSNKSVVHCFTGNKDQLKAYIDLGCFIGITGWISDNRRNNDIVEALKYLPLDRLMIETDCPYLTPKNLTKKYIRNEPAYLNYINKSIAQLLNKSEEEVKQIGIQNTLDFFSIPEYNISNKIKI